MCVADIFTTYPVRSRRVLVSFVNYKLLEVLQTLFLKGFNELEKLLKASEICIAATEKMIKDSGVAGQATYDKTVERLLAKSNARGKTQAWPS